MKITEFTHKTLSEQRTEHRTKLDEIGPVGALAGGALSYAALADQYGWNPRNWPKSAWLELGADAALGATGVGLIGSAGKAAAKIGARRAAGALARNVNKQEKLVGKGKDAKAAKIQPKIDKLQDKLATKTARANEPSWTGRKLAKGAAAGAVYGPAIGKGIEAGIDIAVSDDPVSKAGERTGAAVRSIGKTGSDIAKAISGGNQKGEFDTSKPATSASPSAAPKKRELTQPEKFRRLQNMRFPG
jgi:hypothetical protein